MRMNSNTLDRLRGLVLVLLAALLLVGQAGPAFGQVTYKICPDPGQCFTTKAAKDKWAKDNSCRFLEDVCDKTPPSQDNKGAQAGDESFWGKLWGDIKGALVYGYEFVKGLMAGMVDQVKGIVDLLRNFGDVVKGLVQLGKAFYDDPKGTLKQLAEVLGQDVVDTLTRATQCGPYDLGKVIGENVSPVLVAKLAIKIGKYAGNISQAVKATKIDLGCASFAAGTPVLTPEGVVPIERIVAGQAVMSRGDRATFADAPQQVVKTFGRNVDHFYRLTTEFDNFSVTAEHPMWIQGRGWTPVSELQRGDVLATVSGDVTVLGNVRVDKAIRVYNFSVDKTPSYFVGQGVWAHNAKCDLPNTVYRAPKSPSGYAVGQSDGGPGIWSDRDALNRPINRGDPSDPNFIYENEITGAPRNVEYLYNGKVFDGYDAQRKVLIDAKRYEADNVPGKILKDPTQWDKAWVRIGPMKTILEDARNSAAKAAGHKLEWHVADREAAEALKKWLASPPDGSPPIAGIDVIWSPRLG